MTTSSPPLITEHALARLREHHPGIGFADAHAKFAESVEIPADKLEGIIHATKGSDTYRMTLDFRGVFIVTAKREGGGLVVKTYVRLDDRRQQLLRAVAHGELTQPTATVKIGDVVKVPPIIPTVPPVTRKPQPKTLAKGIDWDAQPLGKKSDLEIARAIGCDQSSVWRARQGRSIPAFQPHRWSPRSGDRKPKVTGLVDEVKRLRAEGKKIREIAALTKSSPATVHRALNMPTSRKSDRVAEVVAVVEAPETVAAETVSDEPRRIRAKDVAAWLWPKGQKIPSIVDVWGLT